MGQPTRTPTATNKALTHHVLMRHGFQVAVKL